jgi:hypothetical protein
MLLLLPWLLTIEIIVFIALVVLVEAEWFSSATLSLIIVVAATQYFNLIPLWGWLKHNYFMLGVYIPGYLAFGALVWSFTKWYLFLKAFQYARQEAIRVFLEGRKEGLPPATPEGIRTGIGYQRYKNTRLSDTPRASDYKGKIIAWMCWWPLSMIGTLLNDPVRKFFNWAYLHLSGYYQRMANKMVPELEK